MVAMVLPISPRLNKWPEPTNETPSPLKGEGGGEGLQRSTDKLNGHSSLSLTVTPQRGGGDVGEQSLCCRGPDNEIMETTP